MIAVLDYGIGNLRSIEKALGHVGTDTRLVTDPDDAIGASGVVLPGVGAFGACAQALRASRLDRAAYRALEAHTPFLGVCVGFQLLFEASEESPGEAGLAVFSGENVRIKGDVRLPQMQWNLVDRVPGRDSPMFHDSDAEPWFYFVHSYAPVPSSNSESAVVGTCDYGGTVVAAIERDNCWGTQFHPEKSGRAGLSLLASFAKMCESPSGLGPV